MTPTEFKIKLKEGCESLGIPFEAKNLKDITVDECVQQLFKNFNSFQDKLNEILKKQNPKHLEE